MWYINCSRRVKVVERRVEMRGRLTAEGRWFMSMMDRTSGNDVCL